jgi:hypothetical protein
MFPPLRYGLEYLLSRGEDTCAIDLQRRVAGQKGERLARSHGGFSAIDQSLDAGLKLGLTKITPRPP